MKYIYKGTEKQLIDCGYIVKKGLWASKRTDVQFEYDVGEVLITLHGHDSNGVRTIKWTWCDNETDIKPYIQDLIDLGLVENEESNNMKSVKKEVLLTKENLAIFDEFMEDYCNEPLSALTEKQFNDALEECFREEE